MRICCIGKPETVYAGYVVGKIYTVIEVYVFSDGNCKFRVHNEDGFSPPLLETQYFEIVDGTIPKSWIAYSGLMMPAEGFVLCPQRWARPDFWDACFDGEPWAEELYEQEVAIISPPTGSDRMQLITVLKRMAELLRAEERYSDWADGLGCLAEDLARHDVADVKLDILGLYSGTRSINDISLNDKQQSKEFRDLREKLFEICNERESLPPDGLY